MQQPNGSRIIVALDFPEAAAAFDLIGRIAPDQCRLKIGKEMFTRLGPDFVREVVARGFDVFLDLKFHDIPNTVAASCAAAAELGVWMINVHASGGRRMMEAARERLEVAGARPMLVAVTILTSLSGEDIAEVGFQGTPEENVLRLARVAQEAGLDGVVCSPRETGALRARLGTDFRLVTPGVRPANSADDDQRRVMTPGDAIRAGANYLVIGRPITAAANPTEALRRIAAEVSQASA